MKFLHIILSIVVGVATFILTWLLLEFREVVGDTRFLQQWSDKALPASAPKKEQLTFINVSQDQILLQRHRDVGKDIITDRRLLTYFFRFLNEFPEQHKWLMCDVYFDLPVPSNDSIQKLYDDSLRLELQKIKKLTVSGLHGKEKGTFVPQIFPDLPLGLVDKQLGGANITTEWQLQSKKLPSLPWAMYKALHKTSETHLHWARVPVQWRIQNKNLETYPRLTLADFEDLVLMGAEGKAIRKEFFDKNFKNRYIILSPLGGNDLHPTAVGEMHGSLILLNAYLTLEAGKHRLYLAWIAMLLVVYSVLAYRALYVEHLYKQVPAFLVPVVRSPLFRFLDYTGVFLALSFVSYFLFSVHLPVLVLFVGFKTMRYLQLGKRLQRAEEDLVLVNKNLMKEQDKSEKLLLNIMPKDVVEELKREGKTKIRHFESATVLFADVKGFSKKAEQLKQTSTEPTKDLIELLDATFSEMDKISEKYGLERIKTIGDCYMAVAGVPIANKTHSLDTALAALAIQKWMADEKQKRNGDFWEVRLGMHTGELMAGVIGTQRYAYDVWGSDVNVASRMESGGEIGRVNTSEKNKNLIEDFFEFECRGEIEAKNIGAIKSYFIMRIKPELSADAQGFMPNAAFYTLKKYKFGI